MKVQNVSIDNIKPYENNPRDNDSAHCVNSCFISAVLSRWNYLEQN